MKQYIKPITENVILIESYGIMRDNSEPEDTEWIGAKENTWFDWDDNEFGDTWNNDEDTEPIS